MFFVNLSNLKTSGMKRTIKSCDFQKGWRLAILKSEYRSHNGPNTKDSWHGISNSFEQSLFLHIHFGHGDSVIKSGSMHNFIQMQPLQLRQNIFWEISCLPDQMLLSRQKSTSEAFRKQLMSLCLDQTGFKSSGPNYSQRNFHSYFRFLVFPDC